MSSASPALANERKIYPSGELTNTGTPQSSSFSTSLADDPVAMTKRERTGGLAVPRIVGLVTDNLNAPDQAQKCGLKW